ncbi:MAG: transcriptional regulator [Candidatus Bathyarchaeota archaeon]|nr:transcriptional regulator [Candidatus Bathyarchaeota archaeon]
MSKEQAFGRKPVAILEKIRENLERLNEKIEVMIELQRHDHRESPTPIQDVPLDVMTLLSMPDHLRKTAMTVCRSGRATADEIAQQTCRARAVESAYLNQLVLMGYLKKERKGRKAYFFAERDVEGER